MTAGIDGYLPRAVEISTFLREVVGITSVLGLVAPHLRWTQILRGEPIQL